MALIGRSFCFHVESDSKKRCNNYNHGTGKSRCTPIEWADVIIQHSCFRIAACVIEGIISLCAAAQLLSLSATINHAVMPCPFNCLWKNLFAAFVLLRFWTSMSRQPPS